jgi:hypothetical protein
MVGQAAVVRVVAAVTRELPNRVKVMLAVLVLHYQQLRPQMRVVAVVARERLEMLEHQIQVEMVEMV